MFDRLNPLRVFGRYFERHPWQRRLLYLLPVLLLFALLGPVFGALDRLLALLGRILTPLFETPIGRAILLVVLVGLAALLVFAFLRERLLDIVRRYALARHLRGIDALLRGDFPRAIGAFRQVVRLGRWVDLGKGPAAGYGRIDLDARLKLARIDLEHGRPKRAVEELARIPREALPKRLRRSLAELEARVYAEHPDHLPESVERVLREAHELWAEHPGIAEAYATYLAEHGQKERAVEVLTRTLRKCPDRQRGRLMRRLARLHLELAEAALAAGDAGAAARHVDRALRLDESETALLLRADVHLAKGELGPALAILRRLKSPAAKQRLAGLLRHEQREVAPRELFLGVPRVDCLVALAEYWIEQGELRRAERALRICLREGVRSSRVLALLACIHLMRDERDGARRMLQGALGRVAGRGDGEPASETER